MYHYDVRAHALAHIAEDIPEDAIGASFFVPKAASTASLLIVISAMMGRTKLKYGVRGYRFAMLEAGHVAQNVCLIAEALKLGCCPIGGFVDDRINQFLGIDGVDEAALYLMGIGSRNATGEP